MSRVTAILALLLLVVSAATWWLLGAPGSSEPSPPSVPVLEDAPEQLGNEESIDALGVERSELLRAAESSIPEGCVVRGRVLGPEGRPVPGAEILAAGQPSTTSAENGSFVVRALSAGLQEFSATAPELACPTPMRLRLAPQEQIEGIILRLEPAATLSGRVLSREGAAVSGARVLFRLGLGGSGWAAEEGEGRSWEASTAEDGSFLLSVLPARQGVLELSHPRHLGHRQAVEAPAAGLEFSLRTLPRIYGRVVSAGEEPPPVLRRVRVLVSAGDEEAPFHAMDDPSGLLRVDSEIEVFELYPRTRRWIKLVAEGEGGGAETRPRTAMRQGPETLRLEGVPVGRLKFTVGRSGSSAVVERDTTIAAGAEVAVVVELR